MTTPTTATKWMTWGECIALCASKGVSRDTFINISRAKDPSGVHLLTRKVFPGCKRARYDRASLTGLLAKE